MKRCTFLLLMTFGTLCGMAQGARDTSRTESYTTLKTVTVAAQFPGGPVAWTQYLQQNISFKGILATLPKTGRRWEETAVVEFIVETNGAVRDIKVVNMVSEAVEREAIRIIAQSPRWEPATQNGRKVRALKTQPITFAVEAM